MLGPEDQLIEAVRALLADGWEEEDIQLAVDSVINAEDASP